MIFSLVFVLAYQYLLIQSAKKYTLESTERKWEIIFDEYSKTVKAKGSEPRLSERMEIMQQLIKKVGLLNTGRSMQEELKYTPLENIPYGLKS